MCDTTCAASPRPNFAYSHNIMRMLIRNAADCQEHLVCGQTVHASVRRPRRYSRVWCPNLGNSPHRPKKTSANANPTNPSINPSWTFQANLVPLHLSQNIVSFHTRQPMHASYLPSTNAYTPPRQHHTFFANATRELRDTFYGSRTAING